MQGLTTIAALPRAAGAAGELKGDTNTRGCHECAWGKVAGCWRCGSMVSGPALHSPRETPLDLYADLVVLAPTLRPGVAHTASTPRADSPGWWPSPGQIERVGNLTSMFADPEANRLREAAYERRLQAQAAALAWHAKQPPAMPQRYDVATDRMVPVEADPARRSSAPKPGPTLADYASAKPPPWTLPESASLQGWATPDDAAAAEWAYGRGWRYNLGLALWEHKANGSPRLSITQIRQMMKKGNP